MLRKIRTGMKPIMLIVALVFIGAIFLWGAGQVVSSLFGAPESELAADVNGQKISLQQFAQRYYLRLRQAEENHELTETQRTDLAEQVLNTMVEENLWLGLAQRMNLEVSNDELSDYLNVRYGIGTRMTTDQYKQMIAKLYGIDQSGGSINDAIKEFQNMNRRLLLVSKAKSIMASATRLPETRARLFYSITQIPVTLDLVYLDGSSLMKSLTVTDEEAQTWYDQHPDYFFSPNRAKLEVLSWSQDTLMQKVTVSQAELEEYYEEHKYDESQGGKVRLSSILLTKTNASESMIKTMREKGKALVEDLRKQFETMVDPVKRDELWWMTLAKTTVEKPPANVRAGDTGFISTDEVMARFGKEADDAIAGIFPGDMTMPVLTQDGLRIFRREEDYYPIDWKKEQFQQELAFEKAGKTAKDYAENAQKRLTDGDDIQAIAKDLDANYTLTPFFVAKPSELIIAGDRSLGIPGLNPSTDFATMKSFAYKNKPGAVAPVMILDLDEQLRAKLGGNLPPQMRQGQVFYVYRLSEHQDPGVLPFAEAKTEAINMVKKEKAMSEMRTKADEIVKLARTTSLASVSKEQKLELKHFANQSVVAVSNVPSPEIAQSILNMKKDTVSEPLSAGNGWLVVNMENTGDFNSSDYESARTDMADSFRNAEIQLIFRAWVNERLTEGQESGKITVYMDRAKDYLSGKYRTDHPNKGFGGYY